MSNQLSKTLTFEVFNPENLSFFSLVFPSAYDRFVVDKTDNSFHTRQHHILWDLSNKISNELILDIGSDIGISALALGGNKRNQVISFDIFNFNKEGKAKVSAQYSNISYVIFNLLSSENKAQSLEAIKKSKLIYLDVDPHDGIKEIQFYNLIKESGFSGLLVCDDIHLNEGMQNFWDLISEEKVDLSSIGHASGTGIVRFEERKDRETENFNQPNKTELKLIQKNNETILPVIFYGKNRDPEVLEYNKQVFNFLNIPMNYIEWPFHLCGHGDAIHYLINKLSNTQIPDYFWFMENDSIPLVDNIINIIYEKIKDKKTIFGVAQSSNHKSPNHIYAGPSFLAFAKQLYLALGSPEMHDRIPRSDNTEELCWVAAEKGYNISLLYPKSFGELTEEEVKETGAPKLWPLGNKFKFGIGTQYSDLVFHAGLAGVKRSSKIFIDKCKEVLAKKQNSLEAVITCANYGDILELTLPINKKHFDSIIVITDKNDSKTKAVCDKNGVKCIQTDAFYDKGTIFNKGAAINLGYENLIYRQWCINLDADIILPDNFRHSFFAHDLSVDELYGAPRKFIWNFGQYLKWKSGLDVGEELLTLPGIGVGYFQAFNFNAKCLSGIPVNRLYPDSNTAEQVDINFLYRFYPPPHPQVPKLFFDVVHLGPPGLFNNRKINSKVAGLENLDFKDFPNLKDDEIYKNYPDIHNHRQRPEFKYNKYYQYFKNSINHRDFVFRMCLDEFEKRKKPIGILEIGSSRSFDGKAGDGWSTLFWCEYIAAYGGRLEVCDVDPNAIEVSKELTKDYHDKINIIFRVDDGIKYINNTYDLILLDGSDCPVQMKEQFEKIDRKTTKILCDDFHVKGAIIRKEYPDFKLLKVNEIHEMAIYSTITN